MNLTVSLETPRNEAISDLIYFFVYKTVTQTGEIGKALSDIKRLLVNAVTKEKILQVLQVRYLATNPDGNIRQVGIVDIVLDWNTHRLAVNSGRDKILISKDDPLGSMSPALSALAEELRGHSIRHGVSGLTWTVSWTKDVCDSVEKWSAANQQNGLVPLSEATGAHEEARKQFELAAKKQISVRLGVANEVLFNILWLKD